MYALAFISILFFVLKHRVLAGCSEDETLFKRRNPGNVMTQNQTMNILRPFIGIHRF